MSADRHGVVVQKFGGTSLADARRVRRCAARAAATARSGRPVVVVVSAMGDATDRLVALSRAIGPEAPRARDLDLLLASGEQVSASLMSLALAREGVDAEPLVGAAIGLVTDGRHQDARITAIDEGPIRAVHARGAVAVVAGFQGAGPDGATTTLGRGGSDTTAVALAARLGVREGTGACEIYTDVDGVSSADPRVVPNARRIDRLAYEEMVELASLGASVLHARAAMLAQRWAVPLRVLHSGRPGRGTLIARERPGMERGSVVGCALTRDLGRVTVFGLPNRPGVQAQVFEHVARAEVLVDDIIQNEHGDGADVAFTVEAPRLADIQRAVRTALEEVGGGRMQVDVGLAKVSAVGTGMRTHTGVAATMFRALGDAGVNIANITTSEIKISCIVPAEDGERALRTVHEAFGLGGAPDGGEAAVVELEGGEADVLDLPGELGAAGGGGREGTAGAP